MTMRIFLIHHHQSQTFIKENYFICWGIVPVILSRSNTQTFKIFWWYSFIQLPTLYALNQALYTRASFSGEKKSQSQNSKLHFEFSRTFVGTGSRALAARQAKRHQAYQCWKKCGKIQNVGSSSDFEIFFLLKRTIPKLTTPTPQAPQS